MRQYDNDPFEALSKHDFTYYSGLSAGVLMPVSLKTLEELEWLYQKRTGIDELFEDEEIDLDTGGSFSIVRGFEIPFVLTDEEKEELANYLDTFMLSL